MLHPSLPAHNPQAQAVRDGPTHRHAFSTVGTGSLCLLLDTLIPLEIVQLRHCSLRLHASNSQQAPACHYPLSLIGPGTQSGKQASPVRLSGDMRAEKAEAVPSLWGEGAGPCNHEDRCGVPCPTGPCPPASAARPSGAMVGVTEAVATAAAAAATAASVLG